MICTCNQGRNPPCTCTGVARIGNKTPLITTPGFRRVNTELLNQAQDIEEAIGFWRDMARLSAIAMLACIAAALIGVAAGYLYQYFTH